MAEKIDIRELRKLPPSQRLKQLKELEEELEKEENARKREIEEAQKLAQESREEFEVLERIEVPKLRKIKVEELFEQAKPGKKLEDAVEEEAPEEARAAAAMRTKPFEGAVAEFYSLATEKVYEGLKSIRDKLATGAELTGEEKNIAESYINKLSAFEAGRQRVSSEEAREMLIKSEYAVKQMESYIHGEQKKKGRRADEGY